MTKEEAVKKIAEYVKQANEALKEAEKIVRDNPDYELYFRFGPAYGMGGTFGPPNDWDDNDDHDNGWFSSSQSC